MNRYIKPELVKEIQRRYDFLQHAKSLDIKMRCRKLMTSEIENSSQVHSYRMENPKIIVPFCVPRNKQKRDIRRGIKNIEKAFEWGRSHFSSVSFDESFLREIAGRITPELYDGKIAQYRERNTRISEATIMPPYPEKLIKYEIPAFIESLKNQFQCPSLINHIEASTFAHLHLARMHPFIDGNGRSARVLQNIILDYFNLPPPVIETGERMTYYSLIDRAVCGIDENKAMRKVGEVSEGEKLFYEFIAGKINSSLDKIIHYCDHFQ